MAVGALGAACLLLGSWVQRIPRFGILAVRSSACESTVTESCPGSSMLRAA
jgi:hypothetical protein